MDEPVAAKTRCDLCDSPANAANFGGLCDPCEAMRRARIETHRKVLREYGQAGPA